MKGLLKGLFVAGVLAGLLSLSANSAQARPKYKAAFEKQYPEVVKAEGKDGKLTCAPDQNRADDGCIDVLDSSVMIIKGPCLSKRTILKHISSTTS